LAGVRTTSPKEATVAVAKAAGRSLKLSLLLAIVAMGRAAVAGSDNWAFLAQNNSWSNARNWGSGGIIGGAIPGATSGTTNTDTATFGNSDVTTVLPDANRNLEFISFDGSTTAFTIGSTSGNALLMTTGGTIQIASTFSGSNISETINAPVTVEGNYTLANNSANAGVSLDFGGAISAADQGGSALTVAGAGNTDISGAIGGINFIELVKSGAGTLTLSGNNSFTGGVFLSAGIVVIGNNNALGTGALRVSGGTLQADGNGPYTLSNAVSPSSTLTVAGANGFTLAGPISGSAKIMKTGAGTLTLSGNNTFSGGTTISSGVLVSANAAALGTGIVVLNGGTLRAASLASPTGFGGTSTSVTGAGTGWTVNNTAITGNPINYNVLTLTDGALFEARAAYSNTLQPIALGANGFHASYTYTPSSPNLAMAADGVVFVLQNDARGLNAIGGTGGGFAYTSEDGGTAVQPSVAIALNIYGGHVIGTNLITNGNPNNDTYLPVTPVNLISGNPIDVALAYDPVAQTLTETLNEENTNHTFTHMYSTGDLAAAIGSNNVYVGFGGGTGSLVSTQTISNFSYTVTGSAVYANNVVLNGGTNSTIDVAATAANPPTVTMGTLSVGNGVGTTLNVTATTAPMDQAYGLTFGATMLAGNVTFNVANNGAGTGTLTLGAVSDGGSNSSLTKIGAGALTLGGNNTFTGGVTLSVGTIVIGNNNALGTGTLTAAGGTLQADGNGPYTLNNPVALSNTLIVAGGNSFTLAGPISGTAGIMKTGTGTLTLSGTNSFSGATTINAGTLQLANSVVLGTSTVILNGGTLRASSAPVTAASLAGFGGTSTSVTGAGTGWTVNNTAITGNPINNNVLTLTDGALFEARAAYSNTLQPIALGANGFHASYTYTPSSPNLAAAADGVVFVLQNDARGLNAIGGAGGGFAYTSENGTAVQPSVAIALNIYGGHVIGTNLITNGNPNNDTYLPVTPVNLISGFPIDVALAYDPVAQTLTETLNEENTNHTFTHMYSTGNLAAAIGSNNVYIGFGGGTGSFVSTQTISNFSYTVTGPAVSVNNVVLNGGTNSTIDVAATAAGPTVTIGTLSVGNGVGTTLNVTATTAPMDHAYGLVIGATTLAGSVTFNVANNGAGTGTLTLSAVSDGGSNSSITKTGAGTLTLSGTNSLSGATNVTGGTLNTVGSGTIGTGALTISTTSGGMSAVSLGNNQTVSSFSGTLAGAVPTLSIAAGAMLTDNQSNGNTLFPGVLINSGTFAKSGSSSLELNGAPTLNANSGLLINGGTLRFNIFVGGAPTIGKGVTAAVSSAATLELAGSVSALSSGANSANIANNSDAPGVLVSGTNQHVGGIDGGGTTQVNAGGDLTANHIIQGALVIGGTSTNPGLVTIDASDASGNPLAGVGLVATPPIPNTPLGVGANLADPLGDSPTCNSLTPSLPLVSGIQPAAVPEPSTLLMFAVGGLVLAVTAFRRQLLRTIA
jgi:autotransporter-associated beta strand protein